MHQWHSMSGVPWQASGSSSTMNGKEASCMPLMNPRRTNNMLSAQTSLHGQEEVKDCGTNIGFAAMMKTITVSCDFSKAIKRNNKNANASVVVEPPGIQEVRNKYQSSIQQTQPCSIGQTIQGSPVARAGSSTLG